MEYVLVTFEKNWSDEFDIFGMQIIKRSVFNQGKKLVKNLSYINWYFGTNEGFEMSPEKFFTGYTVKKISEKEKEMLEKLFPNISSSTLGVGNMPTFEDILCYDPDDYDKEYNTAVDNFFTAKHN